MEDNNLLNDLIPCEINGCDDMVDKTQRYCEYCLHGENGDKENV